MWISWFCRSIFPFICRASAKLEFCRSLCMLFVCVFSILHHPHTQSMRTYSHEAINIRLRCSSALQRKVTITRRKNIDARILRLNELNKICRRKAKGTGWNCHRAYAHARGAASLNRTKVSLRYVNCFRGCLFFDKFIRNFIACGALLTVPAILSSSIYSGGLVLHVILFICI